MMDCPLTRLDVTTRPANENLRIPRSYRNVAVCFVSHQDISNLFMESDTFSKKCNAGQLFRPCGYSSAASNPCSHICFGLQFPADQLGKNMDRLQDYKTPQLPSFQELPDFVSLALDWRSCYVVVFRNGTCAGAGN